MTSPPPAAAGRPAPSNLFVRSLTALVLGPIVILITLAGGLPFLIVCMLWAALALLEFYALGAGRHVQGSFIVGLPVTLGIVLAFEEGRYDLVLLFILLAAAADLTLEIIRRTSQGPLGIYRLGITLSGLVYAGIPAAAMVRMRLLPDGAAWIFFIFALTWGTDTFAYFGGRFFGRHLLAPRISPKKTVEGAIAGVIGGALLGLLVLLVSGLLSPVTGLLLIIGPPVAVVGDLFESRLKRFFRVKDSHVAGLNIIPGHGGILDRTDALVWVTFLVYVILKLAGIIPAS